VFDLLVVVTEVTIDEACASFVFVFRRIRFCLIVQFSKFVRACFGDSIRIPSLKQEVNNFFKIVFYLFAVSARPLEDMN